MNKVVIKTSIWKSILYMLLSLMFVIGGIFMIWSEENTVNTIIGIISIVFFGSGFFVMLYQVLHPLPRIIIDKNGITDRTLGIGRINWEDIEYTAFTSISSNSFIVLKLKNTEKYLAKLSKVKRKLSKLNKSFGYGELNLNLSLIDMKPQKVNELILKYFNRPLAKLNPNCFSFKVVDT